jgi:TonB family protein
MRLFNRLGWGRALLLSATVVGVVCMSNGAERPAALVGHWVHYEGARMNKPEELELFSDGTGVVDKNGSVTWKVENKRFVLLSQAMALSCDYKVSGYELTLVYDGNGSAVFVDKKKREEARKRETEQRKKGAESRIEKLSTYFTDSRDGQKYRTVTIGGNAWIAQNLNYKTGNSWCYDNDDSKCKQYGRLYDWNTAKTACPAGWHLPTRQEWLDMNKAAGDDTAGKALKSVLGWHEYGNGTDSFGFSALPGGYKEGGSFYMVGEFGNWWTATANATSDRASIVFMNFNTDDANFNATFGKNMGISVRCVQGEEELMPQLDSSRQDMGAALGPNSSDSGDSSDPSARVTQSGVLGIVSGQTNGKSAASADIFGKGGFATDIDKILGGGGSKSGCDGPSPGFGGGCGGVDDILGSLTGNNGGNDRPQKVTSSRAPDLIVDGARSPASINRVVMQNMAALRYVYNKRLREKPGLAGKITVKFAIDEFGKVISAQIVESTISDSELESTVVSRVKSWNFEKIDMPGDVTEVTYPFAFSQ